MSEEKKICYECDKLAYEKVDSDCGGTILYFCYKKQEYVNVYENICDDFGQRTNDVPEINYKK